MNSRPVTLQERRARLGLRHHLVAADEDVAIEQIVDDLVVLHATDPATIYLSLQARSSAATVESIDDALFRRRSMARTLAMRRTLFVATVNLLPVVEGSSSVGVAAVQRARLEKFLTESGMADPGRWLSEVFDEVLAALDGEPEGVAARDLTKLVPELGTKILMAAGTNHEVKAGATSRVLGLMAIEGLLVRGLPTGGWTSRTYRWHRRDRWFPVGPEPAAEEAVASGDLLSCWLARFGPATVADMKWWTGWTMTKTRQVLATIDTVEVVLPEDADSTGDGAIGHLLAVDADPVMTDEPWVALLPALDPTAMGWKARDWYLGDHRAELFDRNGNVGPTVWVDGRIVGGWGQGPDGEVVVALLEPVEQHHRVMIDGKADRVSAFVGDTIVKPSFPTPLQRRIAAGQQI
ncbi:MAG: winged helix DNA-binding domain-containing protein [Acidimicrobiales bacterium]